MYVITDPVLFIIGPVVFYPHYILCSQTVNISLLSHINQDCDFLSVSAMCPLGKQRITTPARGDQCTHIQCFDLETFLKNVKVTCRWVCPYCTKPINFTALRVDVNYQRLLLQSPVSCHRFYFDGSGGVGIFLDGGYRLPMALLHLSHKNPPFSIAMNEHQSTASPHEDEYATNAMPQSTATPAGDEDATNAMPQSTATPTGDEDATNAMPHEVVANYSCNPLEIADDIIMPLDDPRASVGDLEGLEMAEWGAPKELTGV